MVRRRVVGRLLAAVVALLVVGTVVTPVYATPAQRTVHIVRAGETLYSIARAYGVDVWALANANGVANPNRIYGGQRLVVATGEGGRTPPRSGWAPSGRVHIVQPGENLYRIALNYGVSQWAIARANGIANPNYIYAGQRLVIPWVHEDGLPGGEQTMSFSGARAERGTALHRAEHHRGRDGW
jgi:LysM repeat protein